MNETFVTVDETIVTVNHLDLCPHGCAVELAQNRRLSGQTRPVNENS
jgi:hypothetical protein